MNENITLIAAKLPEPPKEKTTVTPLEIIAAGLYTEEQLLNTIEELIIKGKSYRSICKELNISLMGLSRWLSNPLQSTRVKSAVRISADYYADMSIQVLKNAPSDKLELMRARELSSAYRWMARVRDTSKYGEKLDVTTDGQSINIVSLGTGIAPPETQQTTIDITHSETE